MTDRLLAVFTCILFFAPVAPMPFASAQMLAAARENARAGKVDAATANLAAAPRTAEAESLLCSLYGSIDQLDDALHACEAAAAAAPGSSDDALALARAYGSKADHSGALTGMRMVGKIRENFERAVQLDGKSVEALSDLGQFYVEAPNLFGGGSDKAHSLVTRLQPLSPARAHRLAGMIAAKAKDEATAEKEFEAEVAVRQSPEAYVDLATFYKSRKDDDRAAQNAALAMRHDVHHGPDTLDAARILIELKRDPKAVQEGLRGYLASPQAGTVASYAKAHVLLGVLLKNMGDRTGAQAEFASALALAHNYVAARKESLP